MRSWDRRRVAIKDDTKGGRETGSTGVPVGTFKDLVRPKGGVPETYTKGNRTLQEGHLFRERESSESGLKGLVEGSLGGE